MEKRKKYDIWNTELPGPYPWRAQMDNYVAHFQTKEQAEKYVIYVKEFNGEISHEDARNARAALVR